MEKTMATKKSNKEGGVKRMKRALFLSVVVGMMMVGIGSAYGMPFMLNVNPGGTTTGVSSSGDADYFTDLLTAITIYAETTSYPIPATPNPYDFVDKGDFHSTGLTFLSYSNTDDEGFGLNHNWILTGRWDNLKGYYDSDGNPHYTSGTAKVYIDDLDPLPAINYDSNNDGILEGSYDDDSGSFTDGVHVATLELINGGVDTDGVGLLFKWRFTYMLPGLWLDQYGNDLEPSASLDLVVATTDINSHNVITYPLGDPRYGQVDSDHDGSLNIDIVPEPTTMLLLGSGLLGLLGLGVRKRRKISS